MMDSNAPKNILDESDVSRDVSLLGDSGRSGGSDLIFPTGPSAAHQCTKMQESKTMDEGCSGAEGDRQSQEGGNQRGEIPIATPASAHEDSRPSLSARVRQDFVPPLPMATVPSGFGGLSAAAAASANHISPMTPMPRPPVGIASSMSYSPPGSTHSQDSRSALAALYQSSRRSRNNTPGTGASSSSTPMAPPLSFPPPPPLFSATSTPGESSSSAMPTQQLRGSRGSNAASATSISDAHKVSLQSSANRSSLLHESWNTSMSSLMTSSYMNASQRSLYNPRLSTSTSQGMNESMTRAPVGRPAGERLSSGHFQRTHYRPNLMDYKIEDRTSNRRLSDEQSGSSGSISLREATEKTTSKKSAHPRLQLNLMDYKLEDSDNEEDDNIQEDEEGRKTPPPDLPTVPTLSALSGDSTLSPVKAPPSPSMGYLEKMSSLQVRCKRKGSDSTIEDEDEESEGGKKLESFIQDEEKGEDASNTEGPPKKKNKMRATTTPSDTPMAPKPKPEEQYLTPQTHKSTMSSASFDIIALPSSRVSSIHTDVSPTDIDMMELLKNNIDDVNVKEIFEADAEEDRAMGLQRMKGEERDQKEEDREESKLDAQEEQGPQEDQKMQDDDYRAEPKQQEQPRAHNKDETPSVKEQRILRRKIQRLLLIRHCSTCAIPPPPLVTIPTVSKIPSTVGPPDQCLPCDDDENIVPQASSSPVAVCPVTSHCAEGKALCAHIRTCKLTDCKYKKCLTSREVLGHYKSCKDRSCEICGQVRALDRSKGHHRHRGGDAGRHQRRRKSDSSIETIDDEGWLNANMMESDHYRF